MVFPKPFLTPFVTYSTRVIQSVVGTVISSAGRISELTRTTVSTTGIVISFVESVKITLYPQPIVFRKTFPMRFSSMHMADRSAQSHVTPIMSVSSRVIDLIGTLQSYVGTIVSFVTKRDDVLYDIYEDTLLYSVEPDTMMYEVLIE